MSKMKGGGNEGNSGKFVLMGRREEK